MYECSNMRGRELDCCDHLQIVLICTYKLFSFSTDKQLVLYICSRMAFRIKATIKIPQHYIRFVDSHFNRHFVSLFVSVCMFCSTMSSGQLYVPAPAGESDLQLFWSRQACSYQSHHQPLNVLELRDRPTLQWVFVNHAVHYYPDFKFSNAQQMFI